MAINFPNENSLPGNLSVGATYLGMVPWQVKVFRPLLPLREKMKPSGVLNRHLGLDFRFDSGLLEKIHRTGSDFLNSI